MPKVATLPSPDKDELDRALRQQKKAVKEQERREFLEKRDNLLKSIPSLPEYQPIIIEDRPVVSHLSSDIALTFYSIFSLIWTPAAWDMLCKNINLYAATQKSLYPD